MSYWDDHPEASERLVALRGEGISMEEIGRRLGISKNAVCGMARRLGLPKTMRAVLHVQLDERAVKVRELTHAGLSLRETAKRLGITKRQAERDAYRSIRTPTATLPPLAAKPFPVTATKPPQRAQAAPKPAPVAPVAPVVPVAKPPEAPGPAVRPSTGRLTCQWPLNDGQLPGGKKGWLFCQEPAMTGRPYCTEHARRSRTSAHGQQEVP